MGLLRANCHIANRLAIKTVISYQYYLFCNLELYISSIYTAAAVFLCGEVQILASWNEPPITLSVEILKVRKQDRENAAGQTEQLAAGVIFEVSDRYYANGSLHDVAFCLL